MADNDQSNDEYQFADLDAITPDGGDEGAGAASSSTPEDGRRLGMDKNNIKRNALIVVGIVIIIMVVYKLMGSVISQKKTTVEPPIQPVNVESQIPAQPQPVVPAPVATASNNDANQVNQRLSALEVSQQSIRTDVTSVNDQLASISNNMNAVVTKITELNGIIASLSAKVDEQSREIEHLTIIRREVKKVHYVPRKAIHYPKYYIQAVIPGRAWLIATNGATLTVREGTIIAGYGMVKLIDPIQGRVMTSSGQVIRFSQADS